MLKDQVVVVTGGAGRIGQEFVRGIVENGGIAILADINESTSRKVLDELARDGRAANAEFVELDITSTSSIAGVISSLHDRHGRIDALVNNAYPRNANYGRRLEDVTYEDFCENVSMHLGGYFLTSQQFANYFKTQGRGSIVNMASIYGVVAPQFEVYENTPMTMPVEYAVIKAGIVHLTKYFAQYLKGTSIRVNSISPGGIFDAQPAEFVARYNRRAAAKGMLDAADITGALLFLLSELSTYVNGHNIVVDDGWIL